jgi:hypothetical protein
MDLSLRRVNNSGDISWHKGRVFISEVFRFEVLGFEQVDEDFYNVYFRDVEIGEFNVEALRFRPVQVMRRMSHRRSVVTICSMDSVTPWHCSMECPEV